MANPWTKESTVVKAVMQPKTNVTRDKISLCFFLRISSLVDVFSSDIFESLNNIDIKKINKPTEQNKMEYSPVKKYGKSLLTFTISIFSFKIFTISVFSIKSIVKPIDVRNKPKPLNAIILA